MELIINVSPDALSLSPGFSPLKLNPGNVMAMPRFQREAGAKKCFAKNFCEKTSVENFDNARLGHLFSLVSGARSAEKNFDNARLGHPFSLVSGARSAEKILLLQPWRAQRGPVLPLGQR